MNAGKTIEYIDQGKFVCTLCLQDRINKLHLLMLSNREVNIPLKRALIISDSVTDILKPRAALLARLKQAEDIRNTLKKHVKVQEIWELIKDENESYSHKYLAQLVFGQAIADEHVSALTRALFEDRLFFKMKDGRFLPNSEERVDQIIRQREEAALKEERLIQGSAWLLDILKGRQAEAPSCREYVVELLTGIAIYGSEASEFKHAKELLARAGISEMRHARDLLVRLGVWEEDENIDLLKLKIPTSFSDKQMDEASSLIKQELPLHDREDMRDLPTITIDSAATRDFDDAISLETDDDRFRLGIHIADVAELIYPDSILDREAKERTQSLYLSRRQISMLPANISEDALSLKEKSDRPAISLIVDLDKNINIMSYRFSESVIRVDRRLTYRFVNDTLTKKKDSLQAMYQIATSLKKQRLNQGALDLSLPDLMVKFDTSWTGTGPGPFTLEQESQNTPSRMIIAEFMILYNWLTARFLSDNHVPAPFRVQGKPGELILQGSKGYIYYVFQQRRKLSPLQINTSAGPHSGLGLDAYVQATSPLRRYFDLVAQRQIKKNINQAEPLYRERDLDEIRLSVSPTIKEAQMLKRNRQRYWILKFLSQYQGERYKAVVLDELRNKYRIVLTDFLLVTEINRQNGLLLNSGDEIWVELKKADPWEDLIRLAYIDLN